MGTNYYRFDDKTMMLTVESAIQSKIAGLLLTDGGDLLLESEWHRIASDAMHTAVWTSRIKLSVPDHLPQWQKYSCHLVGDNELRILLKTFFPLRYEYNINHVGDVYVAVPTGDSTTRTTFYVTAADVETMNATVKVALIRD